MWSNYIEFIEWPNISIKDKGETNDRQDKLGYQYEHSCVAVKQLQDKVFPDPDIMIPLMGYDNSKQEFEYNIRQLLNNALKEAINEQEK